MNLFQWKQTNLESIREDLKSQIREGFDFNTHFLFSEDDIAEIKEEILIEDFVEDIEFDEEIDLDIDLLEDVDTPQDILEFVPDEFAEKMDLEMEIDLSLYEMDFVTLGKIRDHLFAEDYEVVVNEADNRAKVVFKRAGGTISKKKKCGPGMRLKGNRCIPQQGSQKSKERRKGIKLKRAKKAMGGGAKKRAAIKAKITKKRVSGRSRSYAGT